LATASAAASTIARQDIHTAQTTAGEAQVSQVAIVARHEPRGGSGFERADLTTTNF
jgi:hypothetical protein